jgi:hypothetical protein
MNRARKIITGREKHFTAAFRASIDCFLNRRGIERSPISFGAVLTDINLAPGWRG